MGRLEWNREVERDRAVLENIRALLLVLAALVDRAAGLSAAKRLHVLAILGSGEAEVRSLIAAMASDRCTGAPAEAAAAPPPAAGDAALIAARFRVLALAVDAMLALARGRSPCCRHALSPAFLPGRMPRWTERWQAFPALPPPDT